MSINSDGVREVLQTKYLDGFSLSDITTGIGTPFLKFIVIYPNPANDNLEIKLQEAPRETISLTLIDQFGRKIHAGTMEKGSKGKTISVKDLADGVYILSLQNTQLTHRRKVKVVNR